MRYPALYALALSLLEPGFASLATTDMNIKLQPLNLESAAPFEAVQLIERDGVQLLVVSGGTLSLLDPQGKHLVQEMAVQSGGGWDARWVAGNVATVYTQPGSAVSSIMFRDSGEPKGTRVNPEAFAVYVQPRFVRGNVDGFPLTAVRQEDSDAHVVLFLRNPQTGDTLTHAVGSPMRTIFDARLFHNSDGYTLFVSGPPPDLGGSAGVLFAQRLKNDLSPGGPSIRILGNHPMHEFDAAQFPNGEFAIFATTPAGFLYARGALGQTPLPRDSWIETKWKAPLSSPSLLIHDGSVNIAAIEDAGKLESHVLQGRLE